MNIQTFHLKMTNCFNKFKRPIRTNTNVMAKENLIYYTEMILPAILSIACGYCLWRYKLAALYATNIPNFLLIGILFCATTAMYTLFIGLTEILRGRIYTEYVPLVFKRILLFTTIGSLCTGIIGGVCEVLYEIGEANYEVDVAQETILVIDDSSSMHYSDFSNRRLSAVSELLEHMDGNHKIGLIRFSTNINAYIPLDYFGTNKSSLDNELNNDDTDGNTDISQALNCAFVAFSKAGTPTGTRSIILLTDGKSTTDTDENSLINTANSMNIQINVISLGNNTDKDFINTITSGTGGKAAKAPSDFYLSAAYGVFLGKHINRCLLVPLIVGKHTARQRIFQLLLITIICLSSQAVPTIMLKYRPYINWHKRLSPPMILLGATALVLNDASFGVIRFMLILYLIPFFRGRKKVRKLRKRRNRTKKVKPTPRYYCRRNNSEKISNYETSHFFMRTCLAFDRGERFMK